MKKAKRNKNPGFTLIELLVVISIISLLSSLVLASFTTARKAARDARRKADAYQLTQAINLYYDKYGVYPTGETDVSSLPGWDFSCAGSSFIPGLITAGFISKPITDPTNSNGYCYQYISTGSARIVDINASEYCHDGAYQIFSNGAWTQLPMPKAVLIFLFERGPSSDYKQFGADNAICYY